MKKLVVVMMSVLFTSIFGVQTIHADDVEQVNTSDWNMNVIEKTDGGYDVISITGSSFVDCVLACELRSDRGVPGFVEAAYDEAKKDADDLMTFCNRFYGSNWLDEEQMWCKNIDMYHIQGETRKKIGYKFDPFMTLDLNPDPGALIEHVNAVGPYFVPMYKFWASAFRSEISIPYQQLTSNSVFEARATDKDGKEHVALIAPCAKLDDDDMRFVFGDCAEVDVDGVVEAVADFIKGEAGEVDEEEVEPKIGAAVACFTENPFSADLPIVTLDQDDEGPFISMEIPLEFSVHPDSIDVLYRRGDDSEFQNVQDLVGTAIDYPSDIEIMTKIINIPPFKRYYLVYKFTYNPLARGIDGAWVKFLVKEMGECDHEIYGIAYPFMEICEGSDMDICKEKEGIVSLAIARVVAALPPFKDVFKVNPLDDVNFIADCDAEAVDVFRYMVTSTSKELHALDASDTSWDVKKVISGVVSDAYPASIDLFDVDSDTSTFEAVFEEQEVPDEEFTLKVVYTDPDSNKSYESEEIDLCDFCNLSFCAGYQAPETELEKEEPTITLPLTEEPAEIMLPFQTEEEGGEYTGPGGDITEGGACSLNPFAIGGGNAMWAMIAIMLAPIIIKRIRD